MTPQRSEKPSITVLMACFNEERWVSNSAQSVLNQSFTDFEFLIIDDGSTDRTLEILRSIEEQDERVRVISKSNTGLSSSLNLGLREARGDWIARIDADDLCLPDRLSIQFGKAVKQSDIVFVGSDFVEIDEHGTERRLWKYPSAHTSLLTTLARNDAFPPHSSAFFSRKAAQRIGGYRDTLKRAEDHDLWLRLSELGHLVSIPSPLVKIRKHGGQISHDQGGLRQLADARAAAASYWLRHFGAQDPLACEKQMQDTFVSWIENQIQTGMDMEALRLGQYIRNTISEANSPAQYIALLAKVVRSPRVSYMYISRKFFIKNRCKQLALLWLASGQSETTTREKQDS